MSHVAKRSLLLLIASISMLICLARASTSDKCSAPKAKASNSVSGAAPKFTPVPLVIPASEEKQHASFWTRVKELISSEWNQVPFLGILDKAFSNFHRNFDDGVARAIASSQERVAQIADPSKRKYVYVPNNSFEKILDYHSEQDKTIHDLVGKTAVVGLEPHATAEQRVQRRKQVLWGWVERTSKFVEHELSLPAYERRLALPADVRPEEFHFLSLSPRERLKAATSGKIENGGGVPSYVTRGMTELAATMPEGMTYEKWIEMNAEGTQLEKKKEEEDDIEIPYETFPWEFDDQRPRAQ